MRGALLNCPGVSYLHVRTKVLWCLAALALLGATVAVDGQSQRPSAGSIGVADRINEYASIASEGSWVALAWAATSDAAGTDVYVAVSRDGGVTFGPPVRVNAVEQQASLNGEQPPRIAFVK